VVREQAESKIVWKIPMTYLPDPIEIPKSLVETSGNGSKKVDVFFNYHCPICTSFTQTIKNLEEQNKKSISVRYHFFLNEPLDSVAYQTVLAALCSNEQNKFLKFHEIVSKSPPVEMEALKKLVEDSSVDMNKFADCMKSQKVKDMLNTELTTAQSLKVDLNGTVFIDGYRLPSQESIQSMQMLLDKP
jgi:protein-disulfide isomerase